MSITFRNYIHEPRFGKDFQKVSDFFHRINGSKTKTINFTFGRWDWMISRITENEDDRKLIGIWENDGEIVAVATFEDVINNVYLITDENYEFLYKEMIEYSKKAFTREKQLSIAIEDSDRVLQRLAKNFGFIPTQYKEPYSFMNLKSYLNYDLPDGYHITNMKEDWDYKKYNKVLWKGFNHEGEVDQSEEEIIFRKTMLASPNIDPEMIASMVDKTGEYVSHAGLWHRKDDLNAYVEPVATIPEARKKGLAKACIYYTLNKAYDLGARVAFVGSSQQFYYNIGFSPYTNFTFWKLTLK